MPVTLMPTSRLQTLRVNAGPQPLALPPVATYGQPVQDFHNPYLNFYQAKLPTGATWYFTHQPVGKGSVQAIPVIYWPGKEPVVRLEITRRAAMGGRLSLELPGGGWNASETATQALQREVDEELGLTSAIHWPVDNPFAVSPGMTTQQTAIGIAAIDGRQIPRPQWERDEYFTIAGTMDVPVTVLQDESAFRAWMNACHQNGFVISANVLAARALLPLDIANPKYLAKH